jgi:hypothetical protein
MTRSGRFRKQCLFGYFVFFAFVDGYKSKWSESIRLEANARRIVHGSASPEQVKACITRCFLENEECSAIALGAEVAESRNDALRP